MTEEKKSMYLAIGAVVQFDGEDANPFISLDASNLKDFVEYLQTYGAKYLKGLSTDEIRAGVKDKTIPRINLNYYSPSEKAPDFIKKNVVLKLTEL